MTNLELAEKDLVGTEGEGDSHLVELSEMVQPDTAAENPAWFSEHKLALAALGGAALTLLGAASGAAVFRRTNTA